jgi:hypothetical protein
MDIADIPNLPSREERFEAITVDCYNEYEQLSAFEVDCTQSTGPHGADASPIWCKLFFRGGAQWARPRKRTAVSSS